MVKAKLTSEDDLQSDGWIPVSLLCPLTLTRIEIPVRSVSCDHLQCFDLSSYLTINKKRPRWSCPVCSSPAPFRDLRRDDLFVQLIADQSLRDTEMIHVDVNGQWREVSKCTEGDASAVISVKESMTATPSNNPKIAAVQSPLNETSTMSPCILESNSSSRPVTPVESEVSPFSDCVVLLDDDYDDQGGDATQPDLPTVARPTASHGCRGQPLSAVVTNERLFIDLAASSDDEFTAMASAPPPSNLKPSTAASPPTAASTSTYLPAVVPPCSLACL
ncbi:unnamed protein product, partial [Dibothriocephalus latus]